MEKYGVENVREIQEEELAGIRARIREIMALTDPVMTKEASQEFSMLTARAAELETALTEQ